MASIFTSVVTTTVSAASKASSSSASATATLRAAPQGGILEGVNPSVYDPKNPIFMFIIQAGIIIIFCRLLHYPLSLFRQPRVIAEVIGGIILGPSVMMRIPGFQAAIFPAASIPGLSLAANLGLILFLFLVGLEVNMRMFLSNWRVALSVGLAGMALPFGLGCGIAYGLYHAFHNEPGTKPISFGVYMLFIATALSITAFPVLCRILTELKLLGTPVGVTVLAAGVGNDVVGWILLALCVALVNNGSGITALYVLLTAVAWILFLVFAVRPAFFWLLRRSGSLQNGPTQGIMAITLLLVLASSWFTGVIGIHPIFGAFLVGLICPHESGFAIKVAEKVEDLVAVIFLPLYFAYSGLSTNLGLLNSGTAWAYVVGVIAVAFSGKIIGGTLAARANKLFWRESFTIGALMSCKGLVELIVLNIGLQAKILSTRTFTIFVVMALVTTVSTTPLVSVLYPPSYQKKLEAFRRGEIDWDGNQQVQESDVGSNTDGVEKLQNLQVRKLLVYLRLDSLPSLFTFISLLSGDRSNATTKIHRTKTQLETVPEGTAKSTNTALTLQKPFEVHGLRIVELTERTSTVMKGAEIEEDTYRDPVVNAFRTFAQLNNVAVSGGVSVVPESSYAETLTTQAADHYSDLILIPWSEPNMTFGVESSLDSLSGSLQDTFIQNTLETARCNTAIFVNHGFGGLPSIENLPPLRRTVSGLSVRSHLSRRKAPTPPIFDRSHHIFFPFFGGVDDRVALRFVLQLAQNDNITATIIYFNIPSQSGSKSPGYTSEITTVPAYTGSSALDTRKRVGTDIMHAGAAQDIGLLHTLRDSLPASLTNRVVFTEVATTDPITDCLSHARQEVGQSPKNAGDLIVVGRARHTHMEQHTEYNTAPANVDMRKSLGVIAETIVSGGVRASVLVLQAGGQGLDV